MSTVDMHDIDNKRIDIKNPDKISDKITVFNVAYSGKRLIFQTPKCKISSFPIILDCTKQEYYKIVLCFYNYTVDSRTRKFIDNILSIEKMLKHDMMSLANKSKTKSKNLCINSIIKFNNKKTNAFLVANIQKEHNKPVISVFDCEKKKKDITYLQVGTKQISLIYFKDIVQYENRFKLNFVILQSKIYEPLIRLDNLLIIDDIDDIDFTIDTPSVIVNTDSKESILKTDILTAPPPPPPPPPQSNIKPVIMNHKPIMTHKNTNEKEDTKSQNNSCFRPPTKDELVNAISRLKKKPIINNNNT